MRSVPVNQPTLMSTISDSPTPDAIEQTSRQPIHQSFRLGEFEFVYTLKFPPTSLEPTWEIKCTLHDEEEPRPLQPPTENRDSPAFWHYHATSLFQSAILFSLPAIETLTTTTAASCSSPYDDVNLNQPPSPPPPICQQITTLFHLTVALASRVDTLTQTLSPSHLSILLGQAVSAKEVLNAFKDEAQDHRLWGFGIDLAKISVEEREKMLHGFWEVYDKIYGERVKKLVELFGTWLAVL